MDIYISRYLDAMGVKRANSGYRYLVTAIRVGVKDPSMLMKISDLYKKVSEIHGSSTRSIEQAIRYSIARHDMSNKKFIFKAVDYILCTHILDGRRFPQAECPAKEEGEPLFEEEAEKSLV